MKQIQYLFGLAALLVISLNVYANNDYVKNNEKLIFGFVTEKNKKLSISVDDERYIVYRYGSENKIELEYPSDKANSFDKFIYSSYFRGGPNNSAMDLNYLRFYNGDYEYVIYQEYIAESQKMSAGIYIRNLETSKSFDIKARPESVKGSLVDFRFLKGVKTDEFMLNR